MAKLYYGPDYGTISVRKDDEAPGRDDIEVTPEQALAVAAFQISQALHNLTDPLNDISTAVGGIAQK